MFSHDPYLLSLTCIVLALLLLAAIYLLRDRTELRIKIPWFELHTKNVPPNRNPRARKSPRRGRG